MDQFVMANKTCIIKFTGFELHHEKPVEFKIMRDP